MNIPDWLGVFGALLTVATVIFWAGYSYKSIQSLRAFAHDTNNWRNTLHKDLDNTYVRKDTMAPIKEKLDSVALAVDEIKKFLISRGSGV